MLIIILGQTVLVHHRWCDWEHEGALPGWRAWRPSPGRPETGEGFGCDSNAGVQSSFQTENKIAALFCLQLWESKLMQSKAMEDFRNNNTNSSNFMLQLPPNYKRTDQEAAGNKHLLLCQSWWCPQGFDASWVWLFLCPQPQLWSPQVRTPTAYHPRQVKKKKKTFSFNLYLDKSHWA